MISYRPKGHALPGSRLPVPAANIEKEPGMGWRGALHAVETAEAPEVT